MSKATFVRRDDVKVTIEDHGDGRFTTTAEWHGLKAKARTTSINTAVANALDGLEELLLDKES